MGISCAPDIFQSKIARLLGDLEFVKAYLDDCLIVTKSSFEEYLEKLEAVLQRLQMHNLKVNGEKSAFAVGGELEYLVYVITREEIKPDLKKIQAILNLGRSKTNVMFIISYIKIYGRSEHTYSLPFPTKNGPIVWTDESEKASLQMKKMVVTDTMLAYPDFSKEFEIHTDASDYQLGATICQNGKPIAFFNRKLTGCN
jgi:Reverse transcriptase (RNA-dependent DNA polymerase).